MSEEEKQPENDTVFIKRTEKGLLRKRTTNDRLPEQTLDQYITMLCLERQFIEVLALRENCTNARQYFVAHLLTDAVLELDIDLLMTIANRVDGTVPTEEDRSLFANIVGDALDDVLEMENKNQTVIQPDDTMVIAIAKAIFHISTMPAGRNVSKRKDRNKAVETLLSRCGGRKTKPTSNELVIEYTQPEWLQLPEGGENE